VSHVHAHSPTHFLRKDFSLKKAKTFCEQPKIDSKKENLTLLLFHNMMTKTLSWTVNLIFPKDYYTKIHYTKIRLLQQNPNIGKIEFSSLYLFERLRDVFKRIFLTEVVHTVCASKIQIRKTQSCQYNFFPPLGMMKFVHT